MRFYHIIIYVLISTILSSCFSTKTGWVETPDGIKLWTEVDAEATYEWDGDVIENVANGKGTLTKMKDGQIVWQKNISVLYGAVDPAEVIDFGNGFYVGETEGWLSSQKYQGFGVLFRGANVYVGNFENGRPEGNLTLYSDGKPVYRGEWKDGTYNGAGIYYRKDGTEQTGTWQNGKALLTEVELTLENGEFIGTVQDNKPCGSGTMQYNDSSLYTGNWRDGLFNGEGCFKNSLVTIDGEWKKGKPDGHGTLITNEYEYTGEWQNGLPNGKGTFESIYNGSSYSGDWSKGKRSGFGCMELLNGDMYKGNWLNDEYNGYGEYLFNSIGAVYKGNWKDGLQNGEGQYACNEFSYAGNWEDGWINGEGYITYQNGDSYEGSFVENQRHGVGRYVFQNGNIYEGEFTNDVINGLGVFYFNDGSRYEGEFTDGKIEGAGTLFCNLDGQEVAITAQWDGSRHIPKQASVLFSNGNLYEGDIINGQPTANGQWSTLEEREKGESFSQKANNWYKEHRDVWNKAVMITSSFLTIVEFAAPIIGALVGGPAGAVIGLQIAKAASLANVALNVVDASVAIASAAVDGDYETMSKEIAVNAALIFVPKALRQIPARKTLAKLSEKALGIGKNISKVAINSKGFRKMCQIVKDQQGRLSLQFGKGVAGRQASKVFNSIADKYRQAAKDVAEMQKREAVKKTASTQIAEKTNGSLKTASKSTKDYKRVVDKKLKDGPVTKDVQVTKNPDGSETMRPKNPDEYPNCNATIKGDEISAKSGGYEQKGKEGLNGYLAEVPNKRYIIDNGAFKYKTDKLGRVQHAEQDWNKSSKLGERNKKRDTKTEKSVVDEKDGVSGKDDAGHLFSREGKGPNESINQVPMERNFQQHGAWREYEKMEKKLAEKYVAEGKQVTTTRDLIYKGSSKRPHKIRCQIIVDGKVVKEVELINPMP